MTNLAVGRFDSILVRLKGSTAARASRKDWFRFHTGSIKSATFILTQQRGENQFRFHTGSIKRTLNGRTFRGVDLSFDSILVRLKAQNPDR